MSSRKLKLTRGIPSISHITQDLIFHNFIFFDCLTNAVIILSNKKIEERTSLQRDQRIGFVDTCALSQTIVQLTKKFLSRQIFWRILRAVCEKVKKYTHYQKTHVKNARCVHALNKKTEKVEKCSGYATFSAFLGGSGVRAVVRSIYWDISRTSVWIIWRMYSISSSGVIQ